MQKPHRAGKQRLHSSSVHTWFHAHWDTTQSNMYIETWGHTNLSFSECLLGRQRLTITHCEGKGTGNRSPREVSRKEDTIRIRAGVNKIEMKEVIAKINETKSKFIEKIKKKKIQL